MADGADLCYNPRMNLLSINNLSKTGREKPLFAGVTFGLQEGEKAALIGRNGTGKSTMLRTIAGILPPDEGTVVTSRSAGISFLPQTPEFKPDDTIKEHIFSGCSGKLELIKEYLDLCGDLGNKEKAERYEKVTAEMDRRDLWNYESQIASVLTTLGITELGRRMGELSGGMTKKVALAQVLVEDTRLLLLDEPTNHLDMTTIAWLQDYLKNTDRAVLMVTHDRYFLDAVCGSIYELARGTVRFYKGNYSSYLEKKETELEIERNTERRIESVLRFERDWLMRGPCARGTKSKSRIQRDMQLIGREKFQADREFSFEVKERRLGGKVLTLHGISKNYPKASADAHGPAVPVIKDFSYTFTKGQKIGIFGGNGSGKSTLLDIITGTAAPDSGSIETGVNTSFGYYMQNPVFADTSLTVLEYIRESAEQMTMNSGKNISASKFLEEFGFSGKIQHSPVSTLSGGERKRLFLVRLLLSNPNFLILDEPTNDFDIFTMNILEKFLSEYEGCLLVVSHDRYFMDKTADSLFILEDDGSVSGFAGKCSEYIEYRREAQAERERAERAGRHEDRKEPEKKAASRKLSFAEQKEFPDLEAGIAVLEARKTELEKTMESGDYGKTAKAAEEYRILVQELEQKYERWAELAERM